MIMNCIALFLQFAKFSYCSFGGMSMIPLMTHDLTELGWMHLQEISDFIAISEMTPGSFTINVATFCGLKVCGVPGAICASLGAMMPSLTIALALAILMHKAGDQPVRARILYYVRPVGLAMIASSAVTLAQSNLFIDSQFSIPCLLFAVVCLIGLVRYRAPVPLLLLGSGILAIFVF